MSEHPTLKMVESYSEMEVDKPMSAADMVYFDRVNSDYRTRYLTLERRAWEGLGSPARIEVRVKAHEEGGE